MDCPAHMLYQHPRYGKAEARAAVAPGNRHIRLDERLEQRGKLVRGDTDARVAHGETQRDGLLVRLHAPDEKGHAAFMREFHSVPHKVEQDLPEPRGIPHKRLGHSFPNVKAQGEPLFPHGMGEHLESVIKHLREVERDFLEVHFAGFDFRKIKDIIDDPQKGLGGDIDFGEVIRNGGGAFALERKICQADDPIHGRTDFVAHGGEELALGTGGFQGFLLAFEQFGIAGREFRRARLHLRFKFSGALEGVERLLFAGVVVDDDAHPFGLVGQRVDRFLPFDQYPPPVPVAVPHPVFVLQRAAGVFGGKAFKHVAHVLHVVGMAPEQKIRERHVQHAFGPAQHPADVLIVGNEPCFEIRGPQGDARAVHKELEPVFAGGNLLDKRFQLAGLALKGKLRFLLFGDVDDDPYADLPQFGIVHLPPPDEGP